MVINCPLHLIYKLNFIIGKLCMQKKQCIQDWDYLSLQVPYGKSWAVFSVDKGVSLDTREYPILTVSHVYSVSTAASASSSDLQGMCFPCAKEFHYPHMETRKVYGAGTVEILT